MDVFDTIDDYIEKWKATRLYCFYFLAAGFDYSLVISKYPNVKNGIVVKEKKNGVIFESRPGTLETLIAHYQWVLEKYTAEITLASAIDLEDKEEKTNPIGLSFNPKNAFVMDKADYQKAKEVAQTIVIPIDLGPLKISAYLKSHDFAKYAQGKIIGGANPTLEKRKQLPAQAAHF